MKTVALLWSIFLVSGSALVDVLYFVSKVGCIVSDNGVEIHTLEVPWILDAFMYWVRGTPLQDCRVYVDHSRRLFFFTLCE